MNYTTKYKHLDDFQRGQIEILLENNISINQIAKIIKRNKSTISREIKRISGKYCSEKASYDAWLKRKLSYKSPDERFSKFLTYLLKNYDRKWKSVQNICHDAKRFILAKVPTVATVYNWISSGKISIKRNEMLYKKRKKPLSTKSKKEWALQNKTVFPIHFRPKSINNREEVGHMEIDLVCGLKSDSNHILTMQDMKSRKIYWTRITTKWPDVVNKEMYRLIRREKISIKSITCDNGIEFEKVGKVGKHYNIKVYRCDPYSSHQRGMNENGNRMIRREFPKGTDFKKVLDYKIDDTIRKINAMKRPTFNFRSANDMDFEFSRC